MHALNAKTADLSIAKLQEMAALLVNDFQDGANEVFAAVMTALEQKMPEMDYVAFCEAL